MRIIDNILMQKVASGFIHAESLTWSPEPAGFQLRGNIVCRGRIVVWVEKSLEIVGGDFTDPLVETVEYRYNVYLQGSQNLFRYDNTHAYSGHADKHHKHVYDFPTAEQLVEPERVGGERWPHLGEVLQEAESWYWVHRGELPEPDEYGDLAKCRDYDGGC